MRSRTSRPHDMPDAVRDDERHTGRHDERQDDARCDRSSAWARHAGYLIGALVNAALLVAVHEWPGWWAVPFLTDRTVLVLGVVNLALVAGLVAQLCYAAYDARWFVTLGGLVTTALGLLAVVRFWQVFPVHFDGGAIDWAQIVRTALAFGIAGSVVGLLVGIATLLVISTGNRKVPGHRGGQGMSSAAAARIRTDTRIPRPFVARCGPAGARTPPAAPAQLAERHVTDGQLIASAPALRPVGPPRPASAHPAARPPGPTVHTGRGRPFDSRDGFRGDQGSRPL